MKKEWHPGVQIDGDDEQQRQGMRSDEQYESELFQPIQIPPCGGGVSVHDLLPEVTRP